MVREWLRDLRKSKGKTLEDMAAALGTSVSNVCNIELGKRKTNGLDIVDVGNIALALGVPFHAVFNAEIEYLKEAGVWK